MSLDPSHALPLDCVSNSATYASPFDYSAVERDLDGADTDAATTSADEHPAPGTEPSPREQLARLLRDLVPALIPRTRHKATVIGAGVSLIVLGELLQPSGMSLRQLAGELGVTASYLSKHGLRIADRFGLRCRWQADPERRKQCSKRQREVAAGVHVVSAKWARDRYRLKRRRQQAEATASR